MGITGVYPDELLVRNKPLIETHLQIRVFAGLDQTIAQTVQ